MYKHGFTIVELIIIITVIGILTVLGTVNMTESQVNSRDAERKSDVETIAMYLETFYNSGNDSSTVIGRYPSTVEMDGLSNQTKILRDIDTKALKAPGQNDSSLIPTNGEAGITKDQYYYIPIADNGIYLCNTSDNKCRSYTLVYKNEKNGEVIKIKSKNQ
jgi:Tfp pilus assembly protein PilE